MTFYSHNVTHLTKKKKKNYKTQQYLCGFLSQISPIGSKEIKALKGQNLEMLILL